MGFILHIPCEDGKLGRVEITKDLDMNFLDYDIEYDIAFEAMGGDPSVCSEAYSLWLSNPMDFICNSGLISVLHLGIISCSLVRQAIPIVEVGVKSRKESLGCLKNSLGLVNVCEKQFRQARRDISRVYHWKQDLISSWNSRVSTGRKLIDMPSVGEESLVNAALECADMVMQFWDRQVRGEAWNTPSPYPGQVIEFVRNAIASTMYQYNNYGGFRLLLEQMPPDFKRDLAGVSRMQAAWAVEILEKTK